MLYKPFTCLGIFAPQRLFYILIISAYAVLNSGISLSRKLTVSIKASALFFKIRNSLGRCVYIRISSTGGGNSPAHCLTVDSRSKTAYQACLSYSAPIVRTSVFTKSSFSLIYSLCQRVGKLRNNLLARLLKHFLTHALKSRCGNLTAGFNNSLSKSSRAAQQLLRSRLNSTADRAVCQALCPICSVGVCLLSCLTCRPHGSGGKSCGCLHAYACASRCHAYKNRWQHTAHALCYLLNYSSGLGVVGIG